MKLTRAFILSILAAVAMATAGCVTETHKAGDATTLLVTRAGDTASIGWISKTDYTYTILFSGGMNGKSPWQVVPGADHIAGTGEQITFTDQVPKDEPRYYRLQIEKK